MSESSEALKDLLSVTIAPRLKSLGFRRSRNEWTRPAGLSVQHVGIQAHRFGPIFTVWVAVEFPAIYEVRGDTYRPTRAMDIGPGTRLGFVMPDPRDRWCAVDDLTAGQEMTEALELYGMAWLDRHSDLRVAAEEAINGSWRAAACVVLGEEDAARRVLTELQHELASEKDADVRPQLAAEIERTQAVLDRAGIST